MRLLKINADGSFSLTRFASNETPTYAILSHTWEAEDQEITFQDLVNGVKSNKMGYKKIQFCGEQAKRDGLQYFWVDSCCIDKSSSAKHLRHDFNLISLCTNIDIQPLACQLAQKCADFS
jgi:hypothetical protein